MTIAVVTEKITFDTLVKHSETEINYGFHFSLNWLEKKTKELVVFLAKFGFQGKLGW